MESSTTKVLVKEDAEADEDSSTRVLRVEEANTDPPKASSKVKLTGKRLR